MITLRCTKKLRDFLGVELTDPLQPTSSTLGDWYANLVQTFSGDLILIVNEKTLLAVAIPVQDAVRLEDWFRMRVCNLLSMIDIDPGVAGEELRHYEEVQYAKTASRSVLASMNDFTYSIQYRADPELGEVNHSLSALELALSETPCGPLKYAYPRERAKELLEGGRNDV